MVSRGSAMKAPKGVGMTAGTMTKRTQAKRWILRDRSQSGRPMNAHTTGIAGITRALLVLSAVGAGAAGTISHSAAQGTDSDVAYVEAVSGRVVASAQENPTLLDVLDVISDRTRLDLTANSELRICHYRTGKLLTLRGPLRASVGTSGVTAENGSALATSTATCAAPVVSIFQGGVVYRGLEPMKATNVPLRPSIKVVSSGTHSVRRVVLWDRMGEKLLTTFDRTVARPTLEDGRSYVLVVERSDGSELKMTLEASAAAKVGPLIVVVR
jgi:hypothetical protein